MSEDKKIDKIALVYYYGESFSVIPVKLVLECINRGTGIREVNWLKRPLDTRFRGYKGCSGSAFCWYIGPFPKKVRCSINFRFSPGIPDL